MLYGILAEITTVVIPFPGLEADGGIDCIAIDPIVDIGLFNHRPGFSFYALYPAGIDTVTVHYASNRVVIYRNIVGAVITKNTAVIFNACIAVDAIVSYDYIVILRPDICLYVQYTRGKTRGCCFQQNRNMA